MLDAVFRLALTLKNVIELRHVISILDLRLRLYQNDTHQNLKIHFNSLIMTLPGFPISYHKSNES